MRIFSHGWKRQIWDWYWDWNCNQNLRLRLVSKNRNKTNKMAKNQFDFCFLKSKTKTNHLIIMTTNKALEDWSIPIIEFSFSIQLFYLPFCHNMAHINANTYTTTMNLSFQFSFHLYFMVHHTLLSLLLFSCW